MAFGAVFGEGLEIRDLMNASGPTGPVVRATARDSSRRCGRHRRGHDAPALPNDGADGLGSSDFYEFLRAGIPAIQLMGIGGDPAQSPMRMRRFVQRLHQPGDVIDEGWDWAGPRQMSQLYLLLGLRLANTDEPPRLRSSPYSR